MATNTTLDFPAQENEFADLRRDGRYSNWFTPAEIRTLLKERLGLKASKVTVSSEFANEYVTITIRKADVNVARVERFADTLNTWRSNHDDTHDGQSVSVSITDGVREELASPYIEPVMTAIKGVWEVSKLDGVEVVPGVVFSAPCGNELSLSNIDTHNRSKYLAGWDLLRGTPWAVNSVAFSIYTLLK